MIRPCPHVAAMDAYALAKTALPAGVRPLLLNQNESALPPSSAALRAAAAAAERAHLYSDPDWTDLRAAIAAVHGVAADAILVGAGSMELIGALIRAYAGAGDEVLSSAHGYAFFRTAALAAGASYAAAPEVNLTVSVDALLGAVTARTKLVCLANPGNPTGTRISRAELIRLRDRLPDRVVLLIDEAYAEFADHLGEPVFDLAARGDTVVLRTFSKAYALAGARVGWGVFPAAIAGEVRKLLNPNNVGGVSQAMATAAMRDQAYMRKVCHETAERRDDFAQRLREVGFACPESHTNFVLIAFADGETAASADAALRTKGIVMRPMGFYGLGHCLRATVGGENDMIETAEALRVWRRQEG